MSECLVVLSAATAADVLAALRSRFRVISALPPRLAVVDVDDGEAESALVRLRATPGVETVLADPAAPIPGGLTGDELLFVDAWRQRPALRSKARPGEGLPWDAEGFEPPDRPRRR
ncbi:hypothetical protein RHODGE_RHODGE_00345 [Rhodoplanes serenus]|uniref:Uncharacterized protein n=1 Tax=Rhodoplanes serenus TaxID=200615 RepID=A0A447CPY1_9BRAD|nr:hypothetical protein [Rhodoplanes serenus]VCU07238.1 hypothetical protein RHODGE_RHODGE_00345 [Rhodoplanes serenus]